MKNDSTEEMVNAINQSIAHDITVKLPHSPALADALLAQCEGSTATARDPLLPVEYWGEDDDGNEWSVHLTARSSS